MLDRISHLLKIGKPPKNLSGIRMASGATVPADGTLGYAVGGLFLHTDGVAGTTLYVNEGTEASCDFNPVVTAGALTRSSLRWSLPRR
jgi:hypothetical protein